jgi:hypothetical protein
VQQFGSSTVDHIYAAGTGSDGVNNFVYAAGATSGSVNGEPFVYQDDAFLIKYNSTGGIEWTREFGTSSWDRAYGIAGDSSGNVYVTGHTYGNLTGGNVGGRDVYIRQYNSSGSVVWTDQFGSTNNDDCWGIAVDSEGNSYIVGSVYNKVDDEPDENLIGSGDSFIRKYDINGVKQWTRIFGTTSGDQAYAVAVDSYGNAYVAGQTGGAFPGKTSIGGTDAFVRKYASNGDAKWTCQWGIASKNVYPRGIAADAYGNTYVAGSNTGAFPGQTASGTGSDQDAFVSRITNAGDVDWNRQFGTSELDQALCAAIGSSGNAFVAGYVSGALPGQTYGGNQDAFVREYDSTGAEQWIYQYTTTQKNVASTDGEDDAYGIATDGAGNVYSAGTVNGHFPGLTEHNYDGYILKMIPPSAPSGQTWYLDSTVGPGAYPVMEQTVGTQSGVVPVAGTTVLWLSDQPAGSGGVAFNDGTWKVHLENTFTGNYWVQIGQSNGTYGDFTAFHYGANAPTTGAIDLDFDLTGISVPAGCYLALLVNNTGTGNVITDGTSYLASPDSTPSYPVPEIAAGILLAGGLAGLAVRIVIRRRKVKAAV